MYCRQRTTDFACFSRIGTSPTLHTPALLGARMRYNSAHSTSHPPHLVYAYYMMKFAFRQCPGYYYSFRTKNWHNSSNTNLIQSILLPCVFSFEYIRTTSINTFYPIIIFFGVPFYGIIGLHTATLLPGVCLFAVGPTPRLHATPMPMRSNPPSSSLLPVAAWRSRRASLDQCTRRETATWVVTDIIWKRCSLQNTFSG